MVIKVIGRCFVRRMILFGRTVSRDEDRLKVDRLLDKVIGEDELLIVL
jgi:hypothetical protein